MASRNSCSLPAGKEQYGAGLAAEAIPPKSKRRAFESFAGLNEKMTEHVSVHYDGFEAKIKERGSVGRSAHKAPRCSHAGPSRRQSIEIPTRSSHKDAAFRNIAG